MLLKESKSQVSSRVLFGPAGLGGIKESLYNLKNYANLGLKACEISFTHGVYITKEEDALRIGQFAKNLGIKLSIHAPYWINFNSDDLDKIKKSKERVLQCCKVGTWLEAHRVVFHPGYYGGDKIQAYKNIKNNLLDLKRECESKGYTPKLAPEIMGKINVFGSIDEIKKLYKEVNCSFCIDFAHILARYGDYKFKETFDSFKDENEIHIHFSGIDYGEKGEKNHKKTEVSEWKSLLTNLPKNKEIIIINESKSPLEDSIEGLSIYSKIS
ncbi:TIM barrel protein [Patescibacteria group bacterium]|nr:TIM barrel protein [Patescibacteria group bacterium]